MLKHPTLDKLQTLKFTGMVAALNDQLSMPDIDELSFEERLGLLRLGSDALLHQIGDRLRIISGGI